MPVVEKAKSVAVTLGRAERRAVRVQRRIWLAQMLFWPLLIGAGILATTLVLLRVRSARTPHATDSGSAPAGEPQAAPAAGDG
ncbi:hypothetical protein [Mycolicibacterium mengxianglii]|uniref:hypothetical protein n=1 Tax=Mycolicibacterium mengxianglii TaxID=2736649 RepID=UPI0018EED1C2|nr:hypothetical protein [Mycolicibacterium mengxianglii]